MPNLLLLSVAFIAAQVPADAVYSGFRPSAPADIASAVGDCWRVVGEGGLHASQLVASGWSAAAEASGKPVGGPLEVYVKPGANHRIMVPRAIDAKSICAVIARVSSPPELGASLHAIQRSLRVLDPNIKAMRSGDGILFVSGSYFALVDELVSDYVTKDQPGMRITVAYKNAEKK